MTAALTFAANQYGQLTCPLPHCEGDIYLKRTSWTPLHADDVNDPELDAGVADATSSEWKVVCDQGHVLGLPMGGSDNPAWSLRRFLDGKPPDEPGDGETRCEWCGKIIAGPDGSICGDDDCSRRDREYRAAEVERIAKQSAALSAAAEVS